jgi:23S rRNA (guanosine2251-2'-O)-methyltransferase
MRRTGKLIDKPKPLVIFGINPVLEKLRSSPEQVFELVIVKGRESARLNSVIEEARRHHVPVGYVDAHRLDLLAEGGSHQGVAANTVPYAYFPFTDLLQTLTPAAQGRVLVLDGLTDPRNFGALLRCAEGAGVYHVVIPKDRAVGVTPAAVKSSAGAANYLKIYRVSNLSRALQALKEAGCWIVGLDAAAPESIFDRRYPEKVAVVLGSEGTGLRPLIRRECDFLVSIPMLGKVSSLNVAVAGGICLYELVRQQGPLQAEHR